MTMTPIDQFCNLLKQRSQAHAASVQVLLGNRLYGTVVSVLRQELDSLVRTVFLLSQDLHTRRHFITQTFQNEKWIRPNSRNVVTDREMVELTNHLFGWTKSVYKFGCGFIHLSSWVDFENTDPFSQLSSEEVTNIKQHLHQYHDFPLSQELTITTIIPYLPRVFEKVRSNLEVYIKYLENNRVGATQSL